MGNVRKTGKGQTERKARDSAAGREGLDAAHAAAAKECATFETAEEFTRAADGYFAHCDGLGTLYGEAGLCLWLTTHNPKGRPVTERALREWYDGKHCPYLQEAVQLAYLRIREQIETDPRYQDKGGMTSKAIFLMKQPRLGGYTDKPDQKSDVTVTILHGATVDGSDFE